MQSVTMSAVPDLEMEALRRAQAGDPEAFRVLVEIHYEKIFAIEYKQVRNRELAEELTQETFIKAYRHIKSFRGQSKLSTWLTRIAFNTTATYFKSRRFKEDRLSVQLEDQHVASQEDGQTEELLQRLKHQIGNLAPHHRDVLVLCAMEGKTYEEAAGILEIPIGTIRSRMNTAFKQLRRNFWNG
jgi:RNA polymerase sigma-70 factor (ECF subfamily)